MGTPSRFSTEYWHMGATQRRLRTVVFLIVIGEKSVGFDMYFTFRLPRVKYRWAHGYSAITENALCRASVRPIVGA
ncbi:hypothetical protein GCM10009563_17100 [Subtercola frigoramans]